PIYSCEHVLHGPLAAHGVTVDTQYRKVREAGDQLLLGALGTGANGAQLLALALGAATLDRSLAAAVVAVQLGWRLVQRHTCIAAAAFGHPAAVMAHQRRSEAAAVDEHQHLVALLKMVTHQLDQRPGHDCGW